MRILLAAATLVAGAASASATSFSSQPFPIDPTTAAQRAFASAFETEGGAFGVALAEDTTGDQVTDAVSLLSFNAAGKPSDDKALVRPAARDGSTAGMTAAGGMPIGAGKTFVGASLSSFGGASPAGFLDGQAMLDGQRSGKAISLDDVASGQFYVGYIRELAGGRGLAYWSSAAGFDKPQTATGRFISPKGDVAKATFDLSRPKALFAGAERYLDGFIVQHVQTDKTFSIATVYARIHDSKGLDTGREKKLADKKPYLDAVFTSALGLTDGTILVMRSARVGDGATLFARRYDGDWKPIGVEKTLATGLVEQPYVAQPLPGGELLIGVKKPDGASAQALEFRRFSKTLAPVGPAARVTGVKKPDFVQLLAFENGGAVALYTADGKKMTGRLIKP